MATFQSEESIDNKFTRILNWQDNKLKAKDILGVSENPSLKDLKDAYKKKRLAYHPDKNPNNSTNAKDAFIITTDAYKHLLFIHFRPKFEESFGLSEIFDNKFHLEEIETKFPAQDPQDAQDPQSNGDFIFSWNDFIYKVNNSKLDHKQLANLLTRYMPAVKNVLMINKQHFLKVMELLKSNNLDIFFEYWTLFFELTVKHTAINCLDYFEKFELNNKKEVLKAILFKTDCSDENLINFITQNFKFTDQEILKIISFNQRLAKHFECFMPADATAADKLRFAIQIVKKSPGAYRFLNYQLAMNLEIITHTFNDAESVVLLENLKHLDHAQFVTNRISNNIFYALVNKFPHIKNYKDLNKVFAGPREPIYTYLKRFAAAWPLIMTGTVLLILYVAALQANPLLALLVCFPALMNTTVAATFSFDYITVKRYEHQISRILTNEDSTKILSTQLVPSVTSCDTDEEFYNTILNTM